MTAPAALTAIRPAAWAIGDDAVRLEALLSLPGAEAERAAHRCLVRIVGNVEAIIAAAPAIREALIAHAAEKETM